MSKKRRQPKVPTPSWESDSGTLGGRIRGRNPRVYATAGIVALVVVALAIVGFALFSDYWADQRRPGSTALQVDDTRYTVRHFGDRLRIFVQQVGGPTSQNADPQLAIPAVADQLVEETILFRFASEIEASASDAEIRDEMATRLGMATDVSELMLDTLIEAELSRSGLSEEQYREMIEAAVLRDNVLGRLGSELPDSVESIHYRQIHVGDEASADDIVRRIEEGEDFGDLAVELSQDTATKADGGDAGWVPRGILTQSIEDILFGLEPDGLTTIPISSGVVVFQLLEKEADREIEPDFRLALADRALLDWLDEKRLTLTIVNEMDLAAGNVDKISWAANRAYAT